MTDPIINLEIKPANEKAHLDIEAEMAKFKGKIFHFEVRYSGGNIVDFVIREYVTYETIDES